MRKTPFIVGLCSIILGAGLLLNSFPKLTGFVISDLAPVQATYIFGAAFVVLGLLVLFLGGRE